MKVTEPTLVQTHKTGLCLH